MLEEDKMQFESIDLSDVGPFKSDQEIKFRSQWNLIIGPNGSGKTTIFQEIQKVYDDHYEHPTEIRGLAHKLVFLDEEYSCGQTNPQSIIEDACSIDNLNKSILERLISYNLNKIIAFKKVSPSKFQSHDERSIAAPYEASITDSYELLIHDFSGNSLSNLFQATGEMIVLSLACNLSLRMLIGVRDPIVIDNLFSMLDSSLQVGVYRELNKSPFQKILLSNPYSHDGLDLPCDYQLVTGSESENYLTSIQSVRS